MLSVPILGDRSAMKEAILLKYSTYFLMDTKNTLYATKTIQM